MRFLLLLSILLTGCSHKEEVAKNGPTEKSLVGKYKIVFNPAARVDTFLLDTTTGKTWRQVCASLNKKTGACEYYEWEEVIMSSISRS